MLSVKQRILSGSGLVGAGIVINLLTIIPHYSTLAYDRSVLSGMPKGVTGPISIPAILVVPPINYGMVGIGAAMIIAGSILILSGIIRHRRKIAGKLSC